jgi:hypothetical protein
VSVRAWLTTIVAVVALFLAALLVSPALPLAGRAAYVLPFSAVTAAILAAALTSPALTPRALVWLAPPALLLTALALSGASADSRLGAAAVLGSLLAAGSLAGAVLGGRIEAPGHLVVVAAASTFADLYSVLHASGPSQAALHAPRLLSVLALPWPIPGTREVDPMIGVGDVVFAAVYLAAARKHALPVRRITAALAAGFLGTMLLVLTLERPLPVLPALGLAVLAVEPRAWRVPAKDRVPALIGIAVLGGVFAFLFLR